MASVPEALIVPVLRLTRRNRIWTDAAAARAHLEAQRVRPASYAPPARLRADVAIALDRSDPGWPTYTLTPRVGHSHGTVLYAHGGGWVNEIAPQHFQLCAQLAAEAQVTVIVPIYPLIPWGTAAQVVGHFSRLAHQASPSGPLILAGDSAGGQIALSAALQLRDDHGLAADATILIAPGLDATLQNPAIAEVETTDPWLGQAGIRVFTEVWRGELALEHPYVSPVHGDFSGLGPITLFAGTRDILWPDAQLLTRRARAAGVVVELFEAPGAVHVYPLLPTAAGAAARGTIVERVRAAK